MMRSLPAFPTFLRLATALLIASVIAGCGILSGDKDETAGWSANKLYAEAKDAQSSGAWDKAAKYYEKLEARYPYGRYAQQAQLELGYVYWKAGEAGSAIAASDRFIKLHPNHANVDYAYYLKGLAYFNEDLGMLGSLANQDLSERDPKATREAFATFKELSQRFPDSKYTPDAQLRMRYLVNALANHEVHVARYYYKRGAYVAAANRAQAAIKDFPQSPAVEEALFLLVQSYDALNMPDLRKDAERVMRQNFPNSRYYAGKGTEAEPQAWWKLW